MQLYHFQVPPFAELYAGRAISHLQSESPAIAEAAEEILRQLKKQKDVKMPEASLATSSSPFHWCPRPKTPKRSSQ